VVTTIAPVAAALAHAHEHGVVHGDLSPGNIVFTAEGRPVLTDLGVARVLGEAAAREVTPAYVDPTVARGGAPGPASDVFGVAAAGFHALTGIAPWNAASPADTLAVAAAGVLPDLAELAPDAPPELVAVLARGLAADPHERGSAGAFALDLRHACRPEPVRLPVAGVPDEELGGTGRGPRTELTHQVPGRRRPEPEPVEPSGRWSRAVPLLRRVGVVAAVGAVLAAVVWLGARWGAADDAPSIPAAASRSTPASTPAAGTSVVPSVPAGAEPPQTPDEPGADLLVTPSEPAGWLPVVAELYRRRADAFTHASPQPLTGVYTDDSDRLTADTEFVEGLAAAGEVLRGYTPSVVRITSATVDGDRAELELVDTVPAYEVAAGSTSVRGDPGRPEATVRMVLRRSGDGWRIESAQRTG
jgi:hypothetical protein